MTQASKPALPLAAPAPNSEPQKGWLHRWTRKQWCRHWFVLNGGSLTYYRKPEFEHYSFLDGVLDLSLISRIEVAPEPVQAATHATHHHTLHLHNHTYHHNHHYHHQHQHHHQQQQQPNHHHHHHQHHLNQQQPHQQNHQQQQGSAHFAFSLRMWNGECHLLSAGSAAERSLWLAAINDCADNGCLEDDPATDSASSSDSSPTSNLSAKSIDAGEPLPQWRSTHRCDQLALDQLALSIKSAIRRRDQQNNHSLKFLSDLHAGSGAKPLGPDTEASSDNDNNNNSSNNNNNSNSNNSNSNSNSNPSQAQEGSPGEEKLRPAAADEQVGSAHRYPAALAPNQVQKKPASPPSCWPPSQKGRLQPAQVDPSSQEVAGIQQQQQQQKAPPQENEEPSFKKRPLFAESIYKTEPTQKLPSGAPSICPAQAHEDEDSSNEYEPDKKSPRPQKKRVTFDLSLSSLYQLTSSSGSEDSDDQLGDREPAEQPDSDADELSDSEAESSLSPSSSLSSCVSDGPEEEPECAGSSGQPAAARDEECARSADGGTLGCPAAPQVLAEVACPPEPTKEAPTCRLAEPAAAQQMEQLKWQLEAAQQEVGALQLELSSSYTSRGQLELTCQRLRGDLLARDESQKQELQRLEARVEELSRELASSQRELSEAHRKLAGKRLEEQAAATGQQDTCAAAPAGQGPKERGARNQSWLRLHQQVGSHQPLLLMHHVKHTIAANQQLLGAKLLNHSKQIQRKLNELELKVDRIQLAGSAGASVAS